MEEQILVLLSKYPITASILSVIGAFRVFFKPTLAFIKDIVLKTSSKKDDELLLKVESSKIYKGFVFVIDYLFSIKLPVNK